MITYYDLEKKEKKKYEKEFKKTPVGKEITHRKIIIELLMLAIDVFLLFCIFYLKIENDFSDVWLFTFFVFLISYIYYDTNFTAWLKNKHNIKRW